MDTIRHCEGGMTMRMYINKWNILSNHVAKIPNFADKFKNDAAFKKLDLAYSHCSRDFFP